MACGQCGLAVLSLCNFKKQGNCHVMKNWYASFATIVLNTFIAASLFLVVLWAALELRHVFTGKGSVVISTSILYESFGLTPADRAKATAKEFDNYASDQPFVFNPWTTFMLAPVQGENLNVVNDPLLNHRLSKPVTKKENERDKLVIWGFGGSTLYGFGVPDDQTIPSHLQQILAQQYPGKSIEVMNFGQPYWFSSVEVAAYMALLRSGRKPDIVFFLDGLNDMANLVPGREVPFFTSQASNAWERERSNARRLLPWMTVNESFPVTRVMRYIESKFPKAPVASNRFDNLKNMDSKAVMQVFMNNLKTVTALSKEFGVKPLFFLQPVPWYGDYQAPSVIKNSFPFGELKVAKTVYGKIVSEYANLTGATALHNVLYDSKWPFVDTYHYSDTGNKILAENIARAIKQKIDTD